MDICRLAKIGLMIGLKVEVWCNSFLCVTRIPTMIDLSVTLFNTHFGKNKTKSGCLSKKVEVWCNSFLCVTLIPTLILFSPCSIVILEKTKQIQDAYQRRWKSDVIAFYVWHEFQHWLILFSPCSIVILEKTKQNQDAYRRRLKSDAIAFYVWHEFQHWLILFSPCSIVILEKTKQNQDAYWRRW
jgi:hypothetical protein